MNLLINRASLDWHTLFFMQPVQLHPQSVTERKSNNLAPMASLQMKTKWGMTDENFSLSFCVIFPSNWIKPKSRICLPNSQPKPELVPDTGLIIGWLRVGCELPELLNMAFGEGVDEDGCMAARGRRGPNENIGCRGMNDMCGCICWLLPYPEMLGCEGEADMICCLLLPVLLLTKAGATPGRFIGEVTPVGPNRVDIMRARSAANLCLALSTCSHSFINKVSTSANCFSFSSNLFNCVNKHGQTKLQVILYKSNRSCQKPHLRGN